VPNTAFGKENIKKEEKIFGECQRGGTRQRKCFQKKKSLPSAVEWGLGKENIKKK